MARIVVVDLGMGNLRSVERALLQSATNENIACEVIRSNRPEEILSADKIVVPGQGAFRDCAAALETGLGDVLREVIRSGKPYLGICLGMQVLFESSEEAEGALGLGVLQGHVKKLEPGCGAEGVKIPHIGWNQLEMTAWPGVFRVFREEAPFMYFVHSYHVVPDDPSLIVAIVRHGPNQVTAAIRRDNITAVQFHPEKSQGPGLALLGAFVVE